MAMFGGWIRRLPADVALILAQLPGRDGRRGEPSCRTAQQAADGVAGALAGRDAVPRVLFGHSMGALIAFETARRLQQAGRPPSALIVSAHRAPSLPDPRPPIGHLPMDPFLEEVQRRYGAIPAVVLDTPELRDLLLPALHADIGLVERYHYEPGEPLTCPILAYGGVEDPDATVEDLRTWGRETTARGSVRQFPGGHFYFRETPDQLLSALLADLGPTDAILPVDTAALF
jgi:medium-chain acyl-[acyl-carrier-protein] hydrolase